jgi:hypothetical protein
VTAMTQIEIDSNFLNDLIDTKIKVITGEIQTILNTWNCTSSDQFLDDVYSGKLSGAELDAVTLHQLVAQRSILQEQRYPSV